MIAVAEKIYRGQDPRDIPLYSVAEAARYLRVSDMTLYSWLKPTRSRFPSGDRYAPLVYRDPRVQRLSFWNLVEAYVVRTLRTRDRVPLGTIRVAIDYAQAELGIQRLLIDDRIMGAPEQVFIPELSRLVNLGRGGQLAMEKMLHQSLKRVVYEDHRAVEFYPIVREAEDTRLVAISAIRSFGKPVIASKCISTHAIAERYDSGEDKDFLAKDYGITDREVEEAIQYEAAA